MCACVSMFALCGAQTKSQCYQAWMGFYKSLLSRLRWTPEQLVQRANDVSVCE